MNMADPVFIVAAGVLCGALLVSPSRGDSGRFGEESSPSAPHGEGRYASFVQGLVERLLVEQSARLGDEPDGPTFITVTRSASRAWTSLGVQRPDGQWQHLHVDARPMELAPTTADFSIWPVLERLAQRTGDSRYQDLLDGMAIGFAQWGFDPESGLILVGAMSSFSVTERTAAGSGDGDGRVPHFKPGADPGFERLWNVTPEQMARFVRSAFQGLVTRPEDMSLNRYVAYGWSDAGRQPVLGFNPWHRAFLFTCARLMQLWAMDHVRTGSPETFGWVKAMADKIEASQHPDTGLLPHFFGAISDDDPEQSPTPYSQPSDSHTELLLLQIAHELRRDDVWWTDGDANGAADGVSASERAALADRIQQVAVRCLRGLAEHAWDEERQLLVPWVDMAGGEWIEQAYYTFRTQAEKDAAVAVTPGVATVEVFPGSGFFHTRAIGYTAGLGFVRDLAEAARRTGDEMLTDAAARLARQMLEAEAERTGPYGPTGQLTFAAVGVYVDALIDLHEATGDPIWLDHARRMADREIAWLTDPQTSPRIEDQPWWKHPARSGFLEALLRLEGALQK